MKQYPFASTAILLVLSLVLWGCPYSSRVPLGEPIEAVREALLGSWVAENDAAAENPAYYSINKMDSVTYGIDHFQYNNEKQEYGVTGYVAYTTAIERFTFLNMRKKGTKDHLLHRVDMMPNGFVLYEVTDNIDEQFDSSEELHAFFKEHMHLSFFYNKDEVILIRKPK